MEYLEGRGIVHRDLAARNVLGKQLALLFCVHTIELLCCIVWICILHGVVTLLLNLSMIHNLPVLTTILVISSFTILLVVFPVQNPNVVKITDFGLAKLLDADQDVFKAAGGKVC